MRTLSSAGSAELVPGREPDVKELPEGGVGAASRDEEASASDVRSITVSSTFRADALDVRGADFTHQGTEPDMFETEDTTSGTWARVRRSLCLPIFAFRDSRVHFGKPATAGGGFVLAGVEVVSPPCSSQCCVTGGSGRQRSMSRLFF